MADFSQFFSGQPWGSWGSGAGQAPQPPIPQGPQVPPEVIAALRAKLGLDEPAEAQGAAEAAAARVRAPYAKANERQSGLPDIFNYYSNKLASAVTAPRDALTGAMQVTDPETGMPTREAMERGQGVANLAMTGGVPFAKQGAAGIFGGRLAKTADQAALARATEMDAAGHPKEDIWNQTGWFKGADDKWRFEIPDTAASQLKTQIDIPHERAAVGDVRVGDVFGHSPLFEAYPHLKESPFTRDIEGFASGYYQPETGKVAVAKRSNPEDERSTMLHELQHAVQSTEGFAEGSNPFGIRGNMPENPAWQTWKTHPLVQEYNNLSRSGLYQDELNKSNQLWREKYQPDMLALEKKWIPRGDKAALEERSRQFDDLFSAFHKETAGMFPTIDRVDAIDRHLKAAGLSAQEPRRYLDPMDVYKLHAGEVESRNVQVRRNMTPEKLRAKPPWSTEDAPRERQIIAGVKGIGPQMSVNDPGFKSLGTDKTGTLSDFITAYHGSPHDFDRFDLSKIGTGEGAQAYGHGLYFAENEGVAKGYRDALTNRADPTYNFKGETIPHSDLLRRLQNNFDITGFAARRLLSDIQRGAPLEEMQAIGHSSGIKDAAAWLHKNGASANPMSEGKVYQVAIKAPPEHFLDWDKPLSEQPQHIQDKFTNAVIPGKGEDDELLRELGGAHKVLQLFPKSSGAQAYNTFTSHVGDPQKAIEKLRKAGIPGIKYLDQGSRAAPAQVDHLQRQISGLEDILRQSPERKDVQKALAGRRSELAQAQKTTNNYVVFDDKLIDILKKYGIAGLAALPAMNAYHYQDKGN